MYARPIPIFKIGENVPDVTLPIFFFSGLKISYPFLGIDFSSNLNPTSFLLEPF